MDKKSMEECFSSGEPEAAVNCLFSKTMHTPAKDNVSIIVLKAKEKVIGAVEGGVSEE
jgi:hypothetical protein